MSGIGDPVEVAGVEHDQTAGGIEDIGDDGICGRDVANRCGEHGGQADLIGQTEQSGGMTTTPGSSVRPTVMDDLDRERVVGQQGPPGEEEVTSTVEAIGEECPSDVGVRPEQHPQPRRPTGSRVGSKGCLSAL